MRRFSEAVWFTQFSRLILKSPSINIYYFLLLSYAIWSQYAQWIFQERTKGAYGHNSTKYFLILYYHFIFYVDYQLQQFIEWDLDSINAATTIHATFFCFTSFLLYTQLHHISSVLPPLSLSFCFLPSLSRIFFCLPFSPSSICWLFLEVIGLST